MKLTAKLALSQIKTNRNRSIMTILGIVLSSAMLTAVCGYVESAKVTIYNALGYDSNAPLHTAVLAMGAVLGAIIITASVIVVSNAFRVSAGERTRQFGILKSVGATKKQIAASVLYEGVFLSAIGIPIGIAVGLVIDLIGTTVLTNLLHSLSDGGTLHVDSEAFLTVPFTAPPLLFMIAIVTSFGTVLLSAWLPARKAAKIPAVDAIRSAGEVRLHGRNVRTSKLTQMFFGFEGTLAAKSLKRSRRSFRATVISLTISIVMLIAAGSFSSLMKSSTDLMFPNIDATVEAYWASDTIIDYGGDGQIAGRNYVPIYTETAELITEKLRGYDNTEIYGLGSSVRHSVTLPDGTSVSGALIVVDSVHYEELCRVAGVPSGSNLLINWWRGTKDGKKTEYAPYIFSEFANQTLAFSIAGREPVYITISGELTGSDVAYEISYICDTNFSVIVPEYELINYAWFVKADDIPGFISFGEQVLNELAPQSRDGIYVSYDCTSIADVMKQLRDLSNTIMFFVYGFVGMLTLIAITSVISTINTNIRSRTREFATLESIGMTKSGVKKMLNLESILCSARSLLFGIPLGIIGAYALYQGMGMSVELPFKFPLLLIAECILGVFAVTWITMRYSAGRLNDGSMIETIRGE